MSTTEYLLGTISILHVRHLNTQKQAHRFTAIHAYTMNKITKQSLVDSITHLFSY